MNTPDPELDRLLREYREELRSAGPRTGMESELRAAFRRERRVVPFRSRYAVLASGSLAAAALLTVWLLRPDPAEPVQVARTQPPPVASQPVREELARPQPEARVSPRPRVQKTIAPSTPAPVAAPASVAPLAPATVGEARQETAAAPPVPAEADKKQTVIADATARPGWIAELIAETREQGRLTRVERFVVEQNPAGAPVRRLVAAEPRTLALNAFRAAGPRTEAAASAPASPKAAAPQALARDGQTALGEQTILGYRCVGVRTARDGTTVERWHSAELGLDLLIRTVDPAGQERVERVEKIELR
jgi:hypothetical protein